MHYAYFMGEGLKQSWPPKEGDQVLWHEFKDKKGYEKAKRLVTVKAFNSNNTVKIRLGHNLYRTVMFETLSPLDS